MRELAEYGLESGERATFLIGRPSPDEAERRGIGYSALRF
jgi:hypothetical protein